LKLRQFCSIISFNMRHLASVIGGHEKEVSVRGDKTMNKYYYRFWVPFVMNKKRILVLAIASYIAMC